MEELKQPREGLALISTHWPSITDPMKFILRYAPAIRGYLQALLPLPADVDEVVQEILLNVLERGFTPDRVRRGRFRDYLIATVRYSAWRNLRRKKARQLSAGAQPMGFRHPEAGRTGGHGVARRLAAMSAGLGLGDARIQATTVARQLALHRPQADEPDRSRRRLEGGCGPPKSLPTRRAVGGGVSQAAEPESAQGGVCPGHLVDEVERSIETPTPEAVMEELAEVGLLEYVRPYLQW